MLEKAAKFGIQTGKKGMLAKLVFSILFSVMLLLDRLLIYPGELFATVDRFSIRSPSAVDIVLLFVFAFYLWQRSACWKPVVPI